MINKLYYKEENQRNSFFSEKISHYIGREPYREYSFILYQCIAGDTVYSLARKIFGEDGEYNWTVIADINNIRYDFNFEGGEVIKIPREVLSQYIPNREKKVNKDATKSTTFFS
jgi:hypothetical protein